MLRLSLASRYRLPSWQAYCCRGYPDPSLGCRESSHASGAAAGYHEVHEPVIDNAAVALPEPDIGTTLSGVSKGPARAALSQAAPNQRSGIVIALLAVAGIAPTR
jgi:hypothetical protein